MWDQASQVIGPLAGVATVVGTVYAVRHFYLDRRRRSQTARSASATADRVDGGVLPSEEVARFEAARPEPGAAEWIIATLLTIGGVAVALSVQDDEPFSQWFGMGFALLLILGGGVLVDDAKPPRIVELDHEALTVTIPARNPQRVKFPWPEVDSIKVEKSRNGSPFVLRLRPELGLGSPIRAMLWDNTASGFVICETLAGIKPSASDLVQAIAHYSHGQCQVEWK